MKHVVKMLEKGIYNEYVEKNLDPRYKTGTILQSDFWKVFPKSKKEYFKDISPEDLGEFLSLIKEGVGVGKPKKE